MSHRCFIVDAFTDRPFSGNPAGVVLLERAQPDAWMQAVAAELRHSETAFVHGAAPTRALRWFTPTTEVDLCGHATLAAAHVLWTEADASPDLPLRFETRSGALTCVRGSAGDVQLDFPIDVPQPVADPPPALMLGIGVHPLHVLRGRFDYLVEARSADEVRTARPDLAALATLVARGVCITAPGDARSAADVVSRFFAPAIGIDEDPVTGSAHCMLAPYWAAQLGRDELSAVQLSARDGRLQMRVAGNRVLLVGRAVTVLRGALD